MRARSGAVAILAIILANQPGLPAQRPAPIPSLAHVLARAAAYVTAYGETMSLVIGTEHYSQWLWGESSPLPQVRMLVSEYAIVRVDDDWLGFRDVQEVNGKKVGDRGDRLQRLFLDYPRAAVRDGRRIADESARYNLGPVLRNLNTPTMALICLQSNHQYRFKFKKIGETTAAGETVWIVHYEERQKPTIVRTPEGKDSPATGTFWIDPSDGRVLKTQMQLNIEMAGVSPGAGALSATRTSRAHSVRGPASVTVTYQHDAHLDFLVPAEMLETYEVSYASPDQMDKISCRAIYSDFRRFQTDTRWSVPK